ncbi:bifunctional homocysteine S-methyltransferase/methylenetetrahydrofolate reductase [Candidatus Poribacteria bacterium]|nr:bifunctional homocysteine S-methyltransferase/methylenetetrahydrofolate reductase [Candidatus Poribacteria bacterium]MYH83850.1 bifunctional homocysteine S-methyltransferase/methylenetetrahydrofolate reductase [Candidatus Poribacteria bacterium]MYK95597.1 bifunctional homocysteine S-methyltransferase/methylenetetrahydrofolate reductase [Candidatus Poribacteria bacterium]
MATTLRKKDNFMDALAHRILVCDGAIGTELRKRIPAYLQCVDACNISTEHAEKVTALHTAYINAGADVIQTNTYQANREALAVHGLAEQVKEINTTGVLLAREAVSETSYIAGSVGQISFHSLDTTVPSTKTIRQTFKEQMDALVDAGVDLLVLETFLSPKQAEVATKQALTYGVPVVVEISGVSGGTVGAGLDVRVFAQALEQLGANAVGINCRGPHDLVEAMELLAPVIKVPIAVQPNAGNPRVEQGEVAVSYTVEAEVFSDYVGKLVELGANMIGGCCGTTPAYTAKIRQAIAGREPVQRESRIFVLPKIRSVGARSSRPYDNPVQQVFETRKRIVSVEMRANTFPQLRAMLKEAKGLAAIGVDLFDVTDNSGAAVNIGAVGTAYRLQQATQIPTLIHWTTRSRNLISMQSHLLEAEALGIRGIVALSGDHPKAGPYETASLVPDVRGAVQLMKLIARLNQGELADGSSIGEPCGFYYGGGFTIAENLQPHVKHLANKVAQGANFAYTQPVWTYEDIAHAQQATEHLGLKMLYGILPLTSFRSASYLRDNLGLYIPQFIVDKFRDLGDTAGQELGMRLCLELVRDIRNQDECEIDGIYLIPPARMNWKNRARVISEIVKTYRE